MIKPFSTSLPSVSFNRDKGKDPACNLCDLLLVSTGRLRPCGFWLQRIHYEFVNLFGGRGVGEHNGSDRWLVGKPFNKTGDSLPACLPQLQYDWSSIFVWINLYFAASSCCCWTIFLIVFIELLPTAVGCRRVIHVSDLPPKLGWPGLAPQIALSRPDICQIHSRRIICLKLSIQHW